MSDNQIYLDYNATTPLEPEVLESIHDALKNAWGNPSSSHHTGLLWTWSYCFGEIYGKDAGGW